MSALPQQAAIARTKTKKDDIERIRLTENIQSSDDNTAAARLIHSQRDEVLVVIEDLTNRTNCDPP